MKSKILYFVLLLFFIMASCKKYPEDNFISLRRPMKRVVGDWKIKDYQFNSTSIVDQLNTMLKKYDVTSTNLKIIGDKNSDSDVGRYVIITEKGTKSGEFPISNEEKNIFRFEDTYFLHPQPVYNFNFIDSLQILMFLTPLSYRGAAYCKWEIKKLYSNKMNLQLKTDSGNYEIYFEKITKY